MAIVHGVQVSRMGDDQWENIEMELNNSFEDNHASEADADYVDGAASCGADTSKDLTCMGCKLQFHSESGVSTHCIDCRGPELVD